MHPFMDQDPHNILDPCHDPWINYTSAQLWETKWGNFNMHANQNATAVEREWSGDRVSPLQPTRKHTEAS